MKSIIISKRYTIVVGINTKFLTLILCLLFNFQFTNIFAQFQSSAIYKSDSVGYLEVNGNIVKNRKPLENANIIIYEGDKKIASIRSNTYGQFNLKLEFNKDFNIEITKKGLVTKKFEFNTFFPAEKNAQTIIPFDFTVVLFPKYDYIDLSILEKPLAIIKYQNRYNDFFYDYVYSKSISEKVIYLQNKIDELINEYGKNLDKGRKLFESELYREALTEFERAHDIYPDESFPIEKIASIKKILNNEHIRKESYVKILADAEENVRDSEFENAISLLEQAKLIYPTEKYPQQRIAEIKKIIERLALKEDKYKTTITEADNSFSNKMYTEAEAHYIEALIIFPDRIYPTDKINEIHKIQSEINKDALYNIAVNEGDNLLKDAQYIEAIEAYENALTIKADESYPKERIEFINKKISELSIIDIAYTKSIAEADNFMADKVYEIAKINYIKANKLKPAEQYPTDKILKIDKITEALRVQEALYNNTLADADKKLGNKDFDAAIKQYEKAHSYKPDEKYPEIQISKINYLKVQNTKLEAKYLKIITIADKYTNEREYSKAKISYSDALDIKPSEKYPKEKINEINKILAEEQNKLQAYSNLIAAADESMDMHEYAKAKDLYMQANVLMPDDLYSKEKTDELNKILEATKNNEDAYSKMIVAADLLASSLKDYETAKELYSKASEIKPTEIYSKTKLKEIDEIFKGFEAENILYNSFILKADDLYDLQNYVEARDIYKKAEELIPIQKYPRQRILDINKLLIALEYNKSISEIKNELIENKAEKKYTFNPILDKRSTNFVTIDIKNLSEKPFKVLVFYGKNEERSGGFELDVPKQNDAITYNIRVGKQDKWVKAQVNWISIQPIGGDLEVNNIAIRKGE